MTQPRDPRTQRLTTTLVLLNVAVYAWMGLNGASLTDPSIRDLVRFGGNARELTIGYGQYWRLFTNMWVHAGLLHIGLNMWCLWDIGRFLERGFGWKFVLFAYLVSGLAGSVGCLLVYSNIVSVGASGAIFGLYGVLLGFLLRHRSAINPRVLVPLRNSTLSFVGYNLLFGFLVPGIASAGHIGGLLAGFAIGAAKPRQGAS